MEKMWAGILQCLREKHFQGGGLLYKKEGGAHEGLIKQLWCLLGCLASENPQLELSQYILGYLAEKSHC